MASLDKHPYDSYNKHKRYWLGELCTNTQASVNQLYIKPIFIKKQKTSSNIMFPCASLHIGFANQI